MYPLGYNKGMDSTINQINEYINEKGVSPYSVWLGEIKDKKMRAKIIARVDRMALNNFGDTKSVGEGVLELRLHFGAGYRVYYTQVGKQIYLLLCGGDKSSQAKDIKLAQSCWATYKKEECNHG
jgi:putative addiction module killer protein